MSLTDDDRLCHRLTTVWHQWEDGPRPTDVERLLDLYPGGAMGYWRDVADAARRWVSGRAASGEGAATCRPAPTADGSRR